MGENIWKQKLNDSNSIGTSESARMGIGRGYSWRRPRNRDADAEYIAALSVTQRQKPPLLS
jgi:hypothetical protein